MRRYTSQPSLFPRGAGPVKDPTHSSLYRASGAHRRRLHVSRKSSTLRLVTMPMITGNFAAHAAKLVSDIRKLRRRAFSETGPSLPTFMVSLSLSLSLWPARVC